MKVVPPLNANTLIDAILDQCPKLAEVFNRYGMACVGCAFSRFHTLADAAGIYHLDTDCLVNDLSHVVDSESDQLDE